MEKLLPALANFAGMAVTAVFGYMVAKHNNKKDLTVNDRQLLSSDEKNFRLDLLTEIQQYRDEVKRLQADMQKLIQINAELKAENKILSSKVDELTYELRKMNHNSI